MTYVVSDIHGCYKEFMSLLDKIDLKQSDTLYVLGDVIDRGADSVKCLKIIMNHPNIKMLMGNHELLMLEALTHNDIRIRAERFEIWHDYNGGDSTYAQFKALPDHEQIEIIDFISNLPYYEMIKIRSKKYFLVHAGLDCRFRKSREHITTTIKKQNRSYPDTLVWIRKQFIYNPGLPNWTIVFGHTPTTGIIYCHNDPKVWKPKSGEKIGIDCGCYNYGMLGSLCLDDMRELYVSRKR